MRAWSAPVLRLLFTLSALALLAMGCGDNLKPLAEDGGVDSSLSADKALTGFSFLAANNTGLGNDVTATINGTTITATVPFGTNLTALVATFTTTGETVAVGPTAQVSGTTPNDFTSPRTYTVTAEDGSAQNYLVTVTAAASNAKAITAFSFQATDNAGNLTADAIGIVSGFAISVTVPFGTNVTGLIATFATTGVSVKVGSTVQSSGNTANNFISAVEYTVTAADNTTQVYTVTVTIAANDAKAITSFVFESADNPGVGGLSADVIALVGTNTISATVPFGTDVTALVATFSTSGASVAVAGVPQVSGTTPNNFSGDVDYVVTAANGSTHTYTVTVSIAANTAADITSFQFLSAGNSVLAADVTATISGTNITAIVPLGTNISNLVATFSTTGDIVTVAGVEQTTGVTANNFTATLNYLVTAADGITTRTYTVTVINSNSSSKDITAFSILGATGVISGTTITVTVPNGTNVTALIPTITITGVSVSPGSGIPNSFTTPATYTVRAADNTTKSYTVTVIVAGVSDKDITRFTINGLDAVIFNQSATAGTITMNVPNGTDLTSLSPDIDITGVSVSPASGTPTNFSNSVEYIVTAQDGSTKTYTVSIGTVNGIGTKVMNSFSILGLEAQISNGTGIITLVLPAGTDLTAQQPTIVINGSSINPPSNVPQNFTTPVTYTLTAGDGSTRTYTTNITVAP